MAIEIILVNIIVAFHLILKIDNLWLQTTLI